MSDTQRSGRYLGIDMGGTNLRYAIVDASGEVLYSHAQPIPGRIEERMALPASIAERHRDEVAAVGLAVAGTVRDGVLTWSANLGLGDVDFGGLLQRSCGAPSVVVNDARAAGLAEALVGAGSGAHTVLSLTVGTGIGGAIVVGGQLLEGTGDAGEVGHMVIDPAGPQCNCGCAGCWEQYVGGKALARDAAGLYPGHASPLDRLIELAEAGDARACEVVDLATERFARGVDNICAILAPDAIVLGGGIMARNGLIARRYREALRDTRWGARSSIVDSSLGDGAGRIGAALAAARLL